MIAFCSHVLGAWEHFFGRDNITPEVKPHMPNAKILSEKQAIVEALAQRIQNSGSGVLVDYKGINVAQDTELRTELRKNDVEYTVIKNTLARFAFDKAGIEGFSDILNGTTSLATASGDPIAPFRICKEFSYKLNGVFNIKGAYMEGKVLSQEEITAMAALPSKEALYAQVLGTMLAPITSLAVVLGQILEQKGGSIAEPEAAAE